MPAAGVIPAPIAYTKVVVVKKLAFGFWQVLDGLTWLFKLYRKGIFVAETSCTGPKLWHGLAPPILPRTAQHKGC